MIESFFGFSSMPFEKGIPVEDLFVTPSFDEALSRLTYTAENQLFSIFTAAVGAGKTTTLRKFSTLLDPSKFQFFYVSDSQLTPRWFYKNLLEQLGVAPKYYRNEARLQLQKELHLLNSLHNKRAVTVIDEAHLLDHEMMEEIRFLLNFQMDSVNPMALILVGQNELLDRLKRTSYEAIRQRIDLKCSLPPLDRSQISGYISAHLKAVGFDDPLFTDSAVDLIFRSASGSLRLINKLCANCLIFAAQRNQKLIDDHMTSQVIQGEML